LQINKKQPKLAIKAYTFI